MHAAVLSIVALVLLLATCSANNNATSRLDLSRLTPLQRARYTHRTYHIPNLTLAQRFSHLGAVLAFTTSTTVDITIPPTLAPKAKKKSLKFFPTPELLGRMRSKIGLAYTALFNETVNKFPCGDQTKYKFVYRTMGDRWVQAVRAFRPNGYTTAVGNVSAANRDFDTAVGSTSSSNKGSTRAPLLCATFLSANPYALAFLDRNINASRGVCDWAVVFYKGEDATVAAYWNLTRNRGWGEVVHVALHRDVQYNIGNMGYLPKPLLYTHLLPVLRSFKRVWLLDGDMSLTGFNFSAYFAAERCAQTKHGAPVMLSQPVIAESSQSNSVVNLDFWDIGGPEGSPSSMLLHTAATYWSFIEMQAPLVDARFLWWFVQQVLVPQMGVYVALQGDWGMDTTWCKAAQTYLRLSTPDPNPNASSDVPPCLLVLVPMSHQASKAMQVAVLHAKTSWRRYTHTLSGFLSVCLHDAAYPMWNEGSKNVSFGNNREAFLDRGWPRITARDLSGG